MSMQMATHRSKAMAGSRAELYRMVSVAVQTVPDAFLFPHQGRFWVYVTRCIPGLSASVSCRFADSVDHQKSQETVSETLSLTRDRPAHIKNGKWIGSSFALRGVS